MQDFILVIMFMCTICSTNWKKYRSFVFFWLLLYILMLAFVWRLGQIIMTHSFKYWMAVTQGTWYANIQRVNLIEMRTHFTSLDFLCMEYFFIQSKAILYDACVVLHFRFRGWDLLTDNILVIWYTLWYNGPLGMKARTLNRRHLIPLSKSYTE